MITDVEQERKFYEEDLPYITGKLDSLLTLRPKKGLRAPVDCVAFGTAYISTDKGERVNGHYHSICSHPDRGKQFGCLLTSEDSDGTVRRVLRRECGFRVKKGRKGAAELRERIREIEKEFPL